MNGKRLPVNEDARMLREATCQAQEILVTGQFDADKLWEIQAVNSLAFGHLSPLWSAAADAPFF